MEKEKDEQVIEETAESTAEGALSAELDAEAEAEAAAEAKADTDEFGGAPGLADVAGDKPEEKPDEEATAAAEALEETEEKPTDETVPLKTFLAMKSDLKTQIDNLAGQVQATQAMSVKAEKTETPAPKSPLELEAEEQECSVDEVPMTGRLYREQAEFDARQAAATQEAATEKASQEGRAASFRDAVTELNVDKMGEGLDFRAIVVMGEKLLTKGETLDINSSENFGQSLYDKCFSAIQVRGTAEQKAALQSRIDAHKPAPTEEEKAKAEAEAKAKTLSEELDEEGDADEQGTVEATEPNKALAEFCCTDD